MPELSPAAREIKQIIGDLYDQPVQCVVAAALRAVADQVVPEGSACMIRMPETDVDGNEAGGMLGRALW